MDTENPYQAPLGELFPKNSATPIEPKSFKLYSPWQAVGASLIAIPLAPCWLIASNCRSLGSRSLARWWLFGGTVASAILLAVASQLTKPLGGGYWVLQGIVVYHIAKAAHGDAYEAHIARGGARYSNWRVIYVSLMILVIFLVAAFLVVVVLLAFGLVDEPVE